MAQRCADDRSICCCARANFAIARSDGARGFDIRHDHIDFDFVDAVAGAAAVHDSVRSHPGDFSFLATGSWHADHTNESDTNRVGAVFDVFCDATGWQRDPRASDCSVRTREDDRTAGDRPRQRALEAVHARLHQRERSFAFRRIRQTAASANARRLADARCDSRLHHLRAENGVSDRSGAIFTVFGDRPCDRLGDHFDRHAAIAAGRDFDAVEDSPVRRSGWMEPGGWQHAEEFSLLRDRMNAEQVVELSRRTIEAAFWVAMPILLAAMAVGLLINIGQVMTSIQDATVSTVPRLAAVGAILFFLTPWMLHHLVTFTTTLFADFRVYTQ